MVTSLATQALGSSAPTGPGWAWPAEGAREPPQEHRWLRPRLRSLPAFAEGSLPGKKSGRLPQRSAKLAPGRPLQFLPGCPPPHAAAAGAVIRHESSSPEGGECAVKAASAMAEFNPTASKQATPLAHLPTHPPPAQILPQHPPQEHRHGGQGDGCQDHTGVMALIAPLAKARPQPARLQVLLACSCSKRA